MFTQHKRRRDQQRGMVPIEIVLAFPLLLFTLGFVFLFTSICLTRCATSTQARHHAFRARHLPWEEDLLEKYEIEELAIDGMDVPAKMLGPRPIEYQGLSPKASVMKCEVELPVDPVMAVYQQLVSSTKYNCYVLGGSWDYQEMPFAPESKHPPLTIAKNATYVGISAGIGKFANLGSFGSGFSRHSESLDPETIMEPGTNARQVAKQKAKKGLNEAQQTESNLSNQLRQLENADSLDHGLIRQVRESLDEIRSDINSLNQALRLLG